MLVRLERGLVTSRVLAGTIRRTGDDTHDLALAASLARSSKDLEEHEYAVRSVADALASHCKSMNVPESPFVLHLPNVMHLATDVTGRSEEHTSELQSRGHLVCRLLLEKKNELITTCASAALCRSATVRRIYRRSLSLRIVYSVKYLLSYRVS